MNISENLKNIQTYTSNARIIAVTKYVTVDKVIEAYAAGVRDFGENKVQDAESKRAGLPEEIEKNSTWHFLGHLQTNKVKKVVGVFDYIHSVDSLKLAKAISECAASQNIVQKMFIQVNIAKEESKSGFSPEEVEENFSEISKLDSINIVGLMTMAPFTSDFEEQRLVFRGLRELRNLLQEKFNVQLGELSMGMSNDYKIAVEEGATMVRIGQALFI
ncbi:MAG TPA: YggS family pyridoxal phosphate-dependent enzyme [Cyanobacteria bacterium UBA9971]|nr:YggS family pyridoxal phosphate-dependent enzyme [Cyanobacteria bacterium UBA9971]